MFIGHFGVAFGLKRWAPHASLGELIAATAWADILWTVFLPLGWEHARITIGDTKWTPLDLYDYPWSHSLLLLAIWAFVLAALHRTWKNDWAGAFAIAAGVVSHWVLDWITHRPDLPIYPYGPKYGLGLWNSIPLTLTVQLAIFVAGVLIYADATKHQDRVGGVGFLLFLGLMLALYGGAVFGPPPPSVSAIAWTDMGQFFFIALAAWIDRHRDIRT